MRFLVHVKKGLPGPMLEFIEHIATIDRDITSNKADAYDLVVLDEATSLDGAGRALAADALKAGRAVCVLNAGDEHKSALAELIGFRSHGPCAAYVVFPVRDSAGRLHFQILEQCLPAPLPKAIHQEARGEGEGMTWGGEVMKLDLGAAPSEVPMDELKRFGKKVKELLVSKPRMQPAAQAIPPDLKWKSWVYSQCQCFTASGSKSKLGTPKDQYISCQTTYEFDGYLNNWPETGAFQYLFLRQSGIYQTNGLKEDNDHKKGWFLTQLAPSFTPAPELVYYQSSPPNVAGKTSVTTGSSFDVNFSNNGIGASYQVSSSETREISDWGVVQISGSSWRYAQASPYSGTTDSFPSSMVESNDKGELKGLPTISKYSLQFDVQIVWKTNSVVTSTVNIGCANYLRADYVITEYESGTKWSGWWWYYPTYWTPTFAINLGLLT